jgi:hypothetical protein
MPLKSQYVDVYLSIQALTSRFRLQREQFWCLYSFTQVGTSLQMLSETFIMERRYFNPQSVTKTLTNSMDHSSSSEANSCSTSQEITRLL